MARLPRGAKLKLTWLLTALVVVWISGAGGEVEGAPSVASAAFGPGPGAAATSAPEPVPDSSLELRLSRGRVAERDGVRLGILAVVDEAVSPAVDGGEAERLVSVYVGLKNMGARQVAYTALDFEVRDDQGRWASVGARRGPGPMLQFGLLAPGDAISGWRMFRVPAGAGPLSLTFALRPGS